MFIKFAKLITFVLLICASCFSFCKLAAVSNFSFKPAVTCAEMLIIMGILGIVGELTVPDLIKGQLELSTAVQLKRIFAESATGFNQAILENGTPDTWGLIGAGDSQGLSNLNDIITKQFKVTQNCETGEGCFPDLKYKNLNGSDSDTVFDSDISYTKFRLADGTSVAVKQWNSDCSGNWGDTAALQNVCGVIYFDINGNKSPNTYGEDFFGFAFTKYGLEALGSPMQTKEYSFEDNCNKNINTNSEYPNGLSCTAWVMYKGNMDYEDKYYLSWDNSEKDDSNGNCGNGVGIGGKAGSGHGNGIGNTCKGNNN